MVRKRYLNYLGVSAISIAATLLLTRSEPSTTSKKSPSGSTDKKKKPEPKPNSSIKETSGPAACIPPIVNDEQGKPKKNKIKPEEKTLVEPMQIDRSMFPMQFGGKKKHNRRERRSNRNNSSRWRPGDQAQQDSSYNYNNQKKNYEAALAGKSTTDLRAHHFKRFLELVVKLPREHREKYALNDWQMPKEAKDEIAHEEKPIDASTFGESLTFLENSLSKVARLHQLLAGTDRPISPPSEKEFKSEIGHDRTPSQVFNSILEKTHNASNMLEQLLIDIVDGHDIERSEAKDETVNVTSARLKPDSNAPRVDLEIDAGGLEKPKTPEEVRKLDNEVTRHYLAYLDYAHQIVSDWHQRRNKMRPKPRSSVRIRLKEMTMEEQKEWLKILPPDPSIPVKFWYQRLRLFSKYEEGIKLDTEGWFSTTPELIAKMIARRLGKGIVLDAMCGAGGNVIQCALHGATVIALDINSDRLEMCRHNARIYGVEDRITFICGDAFEKLPKMKADNFKVDAIFLSPPWGGQFYEQTKFDIRMMPVDGAKLFKLAEDLCGNIAMYLPRNVDVNQVKNLSESGCEIAKNRLYGKIKSVTCYFGDLNLFKK